MWKVIFLIALAGAVGTLCRYGVAVLVHKSGGPLVLSTLIVNVLGCFLFGLFFSLADGRWAISSQTRLIVLTGFMGAFTTFSTFAFETGQFMRDNHFGWAASNLLGQNVLGILFLLCGFAVGRSL